MDYRIEREGFFFRAVNAATGAKSSLFTSASQAGGYIGRIASKEAHAKAAAVFIGQEDPA